MPAATAKSSTAVVVSLAERFRQLYGTRPSIFRAPGRVNLIGEHTDYNAGFVMPAAIEMYTWVAAGPRRDRQLKVYSEAFAESIELSLDCLAGPPRNHWSDYVRGVAAVLQAAGYVLRGANLLLHGEVPLGAGLSSSASVEVSTALALAAVAGVTVEPLQMAKICQRAEHEYAGMRCGIMDQFVSMFAKSGQALILDCRSLDYELLPLCDETRVVICNTTVKHELAASEYNRRRMECEAGAKILSGHLSEVHALRDVAPARLEEHRSALPPVVFRRCRHVVNENRRVLEAAAALRRADLARFGELMYESHASLRDDYDVSCEELDLLVELAGGIEGVYGARMTGGGFGGCTVNLVDRNAVGRFHLQVSEGYSKATGKTPPIYVCPAAEGASSVPGPSAAEAQHA